MEERATVNPLPVHPFHYLLFSQAESFVQNHRNHPECVLCARVFIVERHTFQCAKLLLIPRENLSFANHQIFDALQLRQPERCLHTTHLVFVSDLRVAEHFVAGFAAMISKKEDPPVKFLAVRD